MSSKKQKKEKASTCAICGAKIYWGNKTKDYGKPTSSGRSHGSLHHYVPERFFGRSANRKNDPRDGIFSDSPWKENIPDRAVGAFCFDCHEELIHNPVLLEEQIKNLRELVQVYGLSEDDKTITENLVGREKIAGRIGLFHHVIATGLKCLLDEQKVPLEW